MPLSEWVGWPTCFRASSASWACLYSSWVAVSDARAASALSAIALNCSTCSFALTLSSFAATTSRLHYKGARKEWAKWNVRWYKDPRTSIEISRFLVSSLDSNRGCELHHLEWLHRPAHSSVVWVLRKYLSDLLWQRVAWIDPWLWLQDALGQCVRRQASLERLNVPRSKSIEWDIRGTSCQYLIQIIWLWISPLITRTSLSSRIWKSLLSNSRWSVTCLTSSDSLLSLSFNSWL